MSEQTNHGHNGHAATDYRTEVIEHIERGSQAAKKVGWDVAQTYQTTLANSQHVKKDDDGAPIYASIMGHEEELGNEFVSTMLGTMQSRYAWNDRFTTEYQDRLMNFFTGRSADDWVHAWQEKGPNMSYAEIGKLVENYQKSLQDEGMKKAQSVLMPLIMNRSTRHDLLKTGGLEKMIGEENEPILPDHIIPAAMQGILSDEDRYKSTIAHMYGLGGGHDDHAHH